MFTVRRDFGFMGRLFGVPRAWLSRVGAFCSSWSVDGNVISLSIPDNPDPVKNPIKIGISPEALSAALGSMSMGDAPGEIVTDTTGTDPDASPVNWTAGGANGLVMTVFVRVVQDGGNYLYPATVSIAADGRIKSVVHSGAFVRL